MAPLAANLPHLVIEHIAQYSVHYEYSKYNPFQQLKCTELKHTLSLASVCRSWRYAILADLYQHVVWCQFGCSRCLNCSCCRRTLPRILTNTISLGLIDRVKSLSIHIKIRDILDGTALHKLRKDVSGNLTLPHVKHLDVKFEFPRRLELLSQSTSATNIGEFCSEIERIFPNARSADMSTPSHGGSLPNHQSITTLLSGIFSRMTSHMHMSLYTRWSTLNPVDKLPLTSITFERIFAESSPGELIRCHSETLESISLFTIGTDALRDMVFDASGGLVAYPRLRKLAIDVQAYNSADIIDTSAYAGIALFPALEKLSIDDSYPFSTAVMFQGNQQTLRYLKLFVRSSMHDIFERNQISACGQYANLEYVSIFGCHYLAEWVADKAFRIGLELGRNASVFKLSSYYPVMFEDFRLTPSALNQNVRILSLRSIRLTVPQAVEVLRRLPHLASLELALNRKDELLYTDFPHNYCTGTCEETEDMGDDMDDSGSGVFGSAYNVVQEPENVHADFLRSHIDLVCADLGSLSELKVQHPLLCPKLVTVKINFPDDFNLIELCRATVMFTQLCPGVKRVEFYSKQLGQICVFKPSDIPSISH